MDKRFVIVRTYSAGVFAGELKSRKGKEVTLLKAIRLWYWKGAASLSQLAMEGVKNPTECKFGVPVDQIDLTEAIEVLSVSATVKKIIQGVASWRM